MVQPFLMSLKLLLVTLSLSIASSTASLPACSHVSHDVEYDYIVVGAGAGGGPLAARLAESGHSVFVLDAGHDANDLNTTIPLYFLRASDDPQLELNYTLDEYPPDFRFQKNDQWYPRARSLGGSAIHNALINIIANTRPEFDGLATIFDDPTWSRENMQNYFKKIERNTNLPHNNTQHGFNGWLETSSPSLNDIDAKYKDDQILAIVDGLLGQTPVPIADLNSIADDGAIGGTAIDFSIGKDHNRSSIRDRLLNVHHQHPRKLTFSLDTLVTKVLMCTDKDGKPSAYGVEYAPGAALPVASNFKGKSKLRTRITRAKKEVIVSAGVFQSPQLLMLSGIGDRAHLKEHGIEPVVHLRGVGNNLQDHDEIAVIWRMKQNFSLLEGCTFGSDPERDPCLKAWRDEGQSNLYSLGPALEAFTIKTSPDYSYPDVMIYIGSVYFPGFVRDFGNLAAEHHNALTAISLKARPSSRGTVKLTGSHPQDRLVINKNRFQGEAGARDVRDLRQAIKHARTIINAPEIIPFIDEEVFPGPQAQSDEDIERHVYENIFGHHACCTNPMGPDNDENAVLDGNFKVRGVRNLRVVDASSWPVVPGYFVTTPIHMISEKAADVILNENVLFPHNDDSEQKVLGMLEDDL